MLYTSIQDFFSMLTPYQRLIGFDVGQKRIGIALSDLLWTVATPLETYERKTLKQDIAYLSHLLQHHNITGVICGWPMAMDGSEGEACAFVKRFAEELIKVNALPIFFQDERLSTAAAQKVLHTTDLTRKRKNTLDDKMAASYFMQITLDLISLQKN